MKHLCVVNVEADCRLVEELIQDSVREYCSQDRQQRHHRRRHRRNNIICFKRDVTSHDSWRASVILLLVLVCR